MKAQRAQARKERKAEGGAMTQEFEKDSARAENEVNEEGLAAAEVHQVNLRDHRKCRQTLENGERCNEDRWIDYHHIIPRRNGGSNHPDNLITLCRFHHDLIHRHESELRPYELLNDEHRDRGQVDASTDVE